MCVAAPVRTDRSTPPRGARPWLVPTSSAPRDFFDRIARMKSLPSSIKGRHYQHSSICKRASRRQQAILKIKKQHAGLQIACGSPRVRGPHLRRRDECRRSGRAASSLLRASVLPAALPHGGGCRGRGPPVPSRMLPSAAELLRPRRRRRRCPGGVRRLPVVAARQRHYLPNRRESL